MANDRFPKTSWTGIVNAREDTPQGRKALDALCKAYWFPIYAFIRRRGASAEQARDQTQGFFARCVVEKNALASVDRARGTKFRTWLLGCVKNYINGEYAHQCSAAAGGNIHFESLDTDIEEAEGRYNADPAHDLTPERLYDRAFAESVVNRVLAQVQAKYVADGNGTLFQELKGTLTAGASLEPYAIVANRLGRQEGDIRKAAFDLRKIYKKKLLAEIACLVDASDTTDPDTRVKDEIRELFLALEK